MIPDLQRSNTQSSSSCDSKEQNGLGGYQNFTEKQTSRSQVKDGVSLEETMVSLREILISVEQWANEKARTYGRSVTSTVLRPCSRHDDDISISFEHDNRHSPAFLNVLTTFATDSIPKSCGCRHEPEPSNKVHRHLAIFDSLEEEDQQVRRLGSWETDGTFGTIETRQSSGVTNDYIIGATTDDDGKPIDKKLLETTMAASQKRSSQKRKRVVKFHYPPVSSLKQCPRAPKEDLPRMFFSENELDQLEADRISTFVADDVEIVAVTSSLSEIDVPLFNTPEEEVTSLREDRLSRNYVSTPRRKGASGSSATNTFLTPSTKASASFTTRATSPAATRPLPSTGIGRDKMKNSNDKRLLKSVQIYLRERSTGSPH